MAVTTEFQQRLKKQFPDIDPGIIQKVAVTSRDEQMAVFRLLCLEDRLWDPGEHLKAESNQGASTSPHTVKEVSPQSNHRQVKSPEQDKAPSLQCPACSTTLSLPGTYPVNLICPTCAITFRQNSPPRAHPNASLLHRHDDNPRASWPACDYCGQQLPDLYERQNHVDMSHQQELEELRVLSNHVKRKPRAPSADDKAQIVQNWSRYLNEHIKGGMDTEESYNVKLQTAEQVEVLLKILFPEAQVFLFGSTVSGTSERSSDVDLAVRLSRDDKQRQGLDDALVIENIWHVLTKEKLGLPWQHGVGGDLGLKRVTKTRVPILGNNPLSTAAPSCDEDARTVTWQLSDPAAVQSKIEKIKKTVATIDPNGVKVLPPPNPSGFTLLFSSQKTALAVKMKEKDAVATLHGVPNVFWTQWDLSLKFFGVRNSCLIKKYLPMPEHRLAAVAVKIWSRKVGINDPRMGLLSSYAVILLFIYYLLRTEQVEWVDPQSISMKDVQPRPAFRPKKERPDMNPGAVLYGFFVFYAEKFDWENTVVTLNRDPRTKIVTKKSLNWISQNEVIIDRANSVRFHLCIEDPYEQAEPASLGSLNLGRKITQLRTLKIRNAFIQAVERCFTTADSVPSELFAYPVRM